MFNVNVMRLLSGSESHTLWNEQRDSVSSSLCTLVSYVRHFSQTRLVFELNWPPFGHEPTSLTIRHHAKLELHQDFHTLIHSFPTWKAPPNLCFAVGKRIFNIRIDFKRQLWKKELMREGLIVFKFPDVFYITVRMSKHKAPFLLKQSCFCIKDLSSY